MIKNLKVKILLMLMAFCFIGFGSIMIPEYNLASVKEFGVLETKRLELYGCNNCKGIIQVIRGGKGVLECCESQMTKFLENTDDNLEGKHVPIVVKSHDRVEVKIGKEKHPMEEEHFIEWIALFDGDRKICLHFLNPGESPCGTFKVKTTNGAFVRSYCNIHGLWQKDILISKEKK